MKGKDCRRLQGQRLHESGGLGGRFYPGTISDTAVKVRVLRGITVLLCSEALKNNVLDVLAAQMNTQKNLSWFLSQSLHYARFQLHRPAGP